MDNQELITLDSETCDAAKKFVDLFYEAFDKRRQVVHKMYVDAATLVWNGNAMTGVEEIAKFLETLPPSNHNIKSLDAQPILPKLTEGKKAITLMTAGNVRYQERLHAFSETFILIADGDTWRILSQRFRFIT